MTDEPVFVVYWNTFERSWNVLGPFDSVEEANRYFGHFKAMANVGECMLAKKLQEVK